MDPVRRQLTHQVRLARLLPGALVGTLARLLYGAMAVTIVACDAAPAAEVRQEPEVGPTSEGGSPVGLDSALALFRATLDPVTSLGGGEPTIEALVAQFGRAVARRDTAALRGLAMNRAEFAYLYYPESPLMRPPMRQEPGLAWFLHMQNSTKGATRLFNRLGGSQVRIVRNQCAPPRVAGRNRLWDDCVQTIALEDDTLTVRLFAGILERDGRYKIFSFANDL